MNRSGWSVNPFEVAMTLLPRGVRTYPSPAMPSKEPPQAERGAPSRTAEIDEAWPDVLRDAKASSRPPGATQEQRNTIPVQAEWLEAADEDAQKGPVLLIPTDMALPQRRNRALRVPPPLPAADPPAVVLTGAASGQAATDHKRAKAHYAELVRSKRTKKA